MLINASESRAVVLPAARFASPAAYSGMFPCFFGGLVSALLASISSARITFTRFSDKFCGFKLHTRLAVEVVDSAAGNDADHATRGTAVLRIKSARLNLDFLN